MAREETIYHTFKKNVPYYNVGVRRSLHDHDGVMLTKEFPTIRIEDKDLRDFKMANKRGLMEGLIVPVEEDNLDWDLPNAVTDEDVNELLKNFARLKSTLQTIDSVAIVQKILTAAHEQEKTKKTISLIQARLDEIEPDEDFAIKKEDMKGGTDS